MSEYRTSEIQTMPKSKSRFCLDFAELLYLLQYYRLVLFVKTQFLIWFKTANQPVFELESPWPKVAMLTIELHSIDATNFFDSRGVRSSDVKTIAGFLHRAFQIGIEAQKISGPKLVDWRKELEVNEGIKKSIDSLKKEVEEFAVKFPLPGRNDI